MSAWIPVHGLDGRKLSDERPGVTGYLVKEGNMSTRRNVLRNVIVLGIVSISVSAVLAASPHYKRGSPQCSASGTTGTCSGSLAGLGNDDLKISIAVTGTATPFCAAPGNESNIVPGQNPVDFVASNSVTVPASEIKNGTLNFTISATAVVPVPTAEEAGCPNPNWNVTIGGASVSSLTLTIEQPPGTVLTQLTRTFTF
jgi:hypothetical protein